MHIKIAIVCLDFENELYCIPGWIISSGAIMSSHGTCLRIVDFAGETEWDKAQIMDRDRELAPIMARDRELAPVMARDRRLWVGLAQALRGPPSTPEART